MLIKSSKLHSLLYSALVVSLSACGGGGGDTTTGSGGAPTVSNKCSISDLALSSGNSATLSKSTDSLSASFTLRLNEASSFETSSNFESAGADDWIEGYPTSDTLTAGTYSREVIFDLNSPKKSTSDRYTKLSLTVQLPGNEACVASQAVSIILNP